MKNRIIAALISLSLVLGVGVQFAGTAYAVDPKANICAGLAATGGAAAGCKSNGPTVEAAIKVGLNILSLVAGIMAVFMIIIAGIRFINSGGDPGSVKGAREAVIYAVVGVVVVAVSQSIIGLILNHPKLQ